MHHEVTCRRLVESVNHAFVNVRRVKRELREVDDMMKAQSHVVHQSIRGGLLTSEESMQWI